MNLNFRHPAGQKPATNLRDFYISSLMLAIGIILVLCPAIESFENALTGLGLLKPTFIVCGCMIICLFILLCGFSAAGKLSVFFLECVCGALIAVSVRKNALSLSAFSLQWFLGFAEVFLLIVCILVLSWRACTFSGEIYSLLSHDMTFSPRVVKYSIYSVAIILVVTSLIFAFYMINRDLLI